MDNDLSKSTDKTNEEEYQFSPEIESAGTAFTGAESAKSKTNIFDKLKRKNILIVVGVIVVAFIVYKFADVLFTTSNLHRTSRPAVTTAPVLTTTATATPLPAAPPVMSDVVNNRLTDIASHQANDQAVLDKLNSQLGDMQNGLSALSNQVATLSNAVQAMATQLAAQQAAAEAAKQAAQKKIAQLKAHPTPKPVYFARSMIPGRAWLLTQNGETITVSVGNDLPGYGTVIAIDPVQGTLTTSTGAIIGYSPGDS